MVALSEVDKSKIHDLAFQVVQEKLDRSQAKRKIEQQVIDVNERKILVDYLDERIYHIIEIQRVKTTKMRLLYFGIAQLMIGLVSSALTFFSKIQMLFIGLVISGITMIFIAYNIKTNEVFDNHKLNRGLFKSKSNQRSRK